ncbi:Protein CBG26138 [Caenorhabditis briggsae]|uniref:Protein CBG26138 n=1 Tax=Caenorhabditis briggsae TaxID=6238 RepID=B6II42_CAEBR|nr:Protein CBG26138 [Caenorhabditis briggsae]CAR99572.1 Protein CBG26138 [Caenorhabditis briggsae]
MPDPKMEVLDGVGHLVDQEMEEVEDVELFPLEVLPVGIVASVLEMMEPHEMLNLALTTPKMEAFFKFVKAGITNFVIHFSGESSAIQVQADGGTIICGTDPLNAKVMVPREIIQSWINQETLLGDLQSVYRNLGQMFTPHNHDTVVLRTTGLDNLLVEESGFAFQFRRSVFGDARWIKLNDLFKIRDLSHVTLKKTSLTNSDMNQFIKHWIDADEDMFGEFYSTGCEDFLWDNILDGIVTLEVKRLCIGCYFM